jgi:hypothetical protein
MPSSTTVSSAVDNVPPVGLGAGLLADRHREEAPWRTQ